MSGELRGRGNSPGLEKPKVLGHPGGNHREGPRLRVANQHQEHTGHPRERADPHPTLRRHLLRHVMLVAPNPNRPHNAKKRASRIGPAAGYFGSPTVRSHEWGEIGYHKWLTPGVR